MICLSLADDLLLKLRVLPSEDIEVVVGFSCAVCASELAHAVALKCTHMYCIACANNPSVKKCPLCNQPKRIGQLVNLGSIKLVRKSEQRQLERLVERTPAPATNVADEDTDEERDRRDRDAIDDAIFQMGYDPQSYHQAVEAARTPGDYLTYVALIWHLLISLLSYSTSSRRLNRVSSAVCESEKRSISPVV